MATDNERIIAALERIEAVMSALLDIAKSRKAATPSNVATDADLDSARGNEKVNFKPRDWTGEFVKGQLMSESHPSMLDLLAETYDYFAGQDEASGAVTSTGKPKAPYSRQSAKRARGWAARLRAGWKPKQTPHVPASEVTW